MKLFKKRKERKETKVFTAKRNRAECIYGPPEMLERYRNGYRTEGNENKVKDTDAPVTSDGDDGGSE